MDVSRIIDELGGTKATAQLFGVSSPAVSNWKRANAFPERIHFRLFKVCKERGVELPEELLSTTKRRSG